MIFFTTNKLAGMQLANKFVVQSSSLTPFTLRSFTWADTCLATPVTVPHHYVLSGLLFKPTHHNSLPKLPQVIVNEATSTDYFVRPSFRYLIVSSLSAYRFSEPWSMCAIFNILIVPDMGLVSQHPGGLNDSLLLLCNRK